MIACITCPMSLTANHWDDSGYVQFTLCENNEEISVYSVLDSNVSRHSFFQTFVIMITLADLILIVPSNVSFVAC
jgi:hypothetical protein